MSLKLFLISQTENTDYDTFDSAVVACASAEEARNMHTAGGVIDWARKQTGAALRAIDVEWCLKPESVFVKYLGEAADEVKTGVICSSFNKG